MTDTVNVPLEAVERFKDALENMPDVLERHTKGQKFNAYDLDDDGGSRAVCIGPITSRPLSLFTAPTDVAELVEASLKLAANALAAAPKAEPVGFSVDDLAQEIRRVDGKHDLGAGALAEALMPFLCRAQPEAPKVEQEPVAYVSRKGFTIGGLLWTDAGRDADLPDEAKLYTHPAPASDELLEALAPFARYYDLNDCHERRPDDALEVPIYDLARAAELIAKHKGPQP